MTHITASNTAGAFIAHGRRSDFFVRTESFNRRDRGDFLAFFKRTRILLTEILWSLGSAESTNRISPGGFVAFFARTNTLLSRNPLLPLVWSGANGVPAPDQQSPSVTHSGNPPWCHPPDRPTTEVSGETPNSVIATTTIAATITGDGARRATTRIDDTAPAPTDASATSQIARKLVLEVGIDPTRGVTPTGF
jgi:hypothetical protein